MLGIREQAGPSFPASLQWSILTKRLGHGNWEQVPHCGLSVDLPPKAPLLWARFLLHFFYTSSPPPMHSITRINFDKIV